MNDLMNTTDNCLGSKLGLAAAGAKKREEGARKLSDILGIEGHLGTILTIS